MAKFKIKKPETKGQKIVAFIIAVVVIFLVFIYLSSGSDDNVSGSNSSSVTPSPNIDNVPGGKTDPEYYRALIASNQESARQAQLTGQSSVSTVVNTSGPGFQKDKESCSHKCCTCEPAKVQDTVKQLLASGKISQATADQLNDLAKKNLSVGDYAKALDKLVREGKLTPEQARELLEQYKKQHGAAVAAKGAKAIDALVKSGKLPLDAANELMDLQKNGASVGDYAKHLAQLVREGKISPAEAKRLLAEYKKSHGGGAGVTLDKYLKAKNADNAAQQGGNGLSDSMSPQSYAQHLAELVREGKLTPEQAKKLWQKYKKSHGLAKKMMTPAEYAKHLQELVKEGKISPEEAKAMLAAYKKRYAQAQGPSLNDVLSSSGDYAAQNKSAMDAAVASGQFQDSLTASAPTTPEEQALLQAREEQIQKIATSMQNQATSIIAASKPAAQAFMMATPDKNQGLQKDTSDDSANAKADNKTKDANKPPIVKAGDIEFAVLDTAVNSDYPDSPVMATIVQGKLKGGKLLGKLSRGSSNSNDRVTLTFTLLNMPKWSTPVKITAVAIDPQTARSALATSVNHHYLSRYSALFASAFLEGYGETFQQAGQVIIPGTSDGGKPVIINSASMSPKERAFAGLGKVGQETGSAAEQYFNTPPTVKVKSGVSLGVLFMQNVAPDDSDKKTVKNKNNK